MSGDGFLKNLIIKVITSSYILNNFYEKINEYLLRSFDLAEKEKIIKGEGIYLYTKKYFDTTSGLTGTAILGWSNPSVNNAINKQLKKISLIDYKYFLDENREKLAKFLIKQQKTKLNQVFFVGGSGGEACEAAMKLSYQHNCARGFKEKWFISRSQSYHGSGSDAISVGDRPNLNIYKSFFQSIEQRLMNTIFIDN